MSNYHTWEHIIRKSREWLRRESVGRGVLRHMKAHKNYLNILRMEAR